MIIVAIVNIKCGAPHVAMRLVRGCPPLEHLSIQSTRRHNSLTHMGPASVPEPTRPCALVAKCRGVPRNPNTPEHPTTSTPARTKPIGTALNAAQGGPKSTKHCTSRGDPRWHLEPRMQHATTGQLDTLQQDYCHPRGKAQFARGVAPIESSFAMALPMGPKK